ncbi:MAG: HEPN domain-containing protein [Burkholderiaceae bacterium]|nr:HEPN domain-containing protein [Burkholderiaceae bacterium]
MSEVAEWLRKAEADYQVARILLRQRKTLLPDNICWSCQQSAEKYLKACLVRYGVEYPRRHDLVQLNTLCADADPDFERIADVIAILDQFGTDIRYPGVSATLQDARDAFHALERLRAFVRAKLGLL